MILQLLMTMGGTAGPTIGTIFNRSNFTDLSGMETSGGFTVSDGAVDVAADATLTKYLRLTEGTCLDRFKVLSTYQIQTVDDNGLGLQIGVNSLCPVDASLYAVFIDNGANAGKVALYQKSTSTFFYSSSALSFSVGNTVTVSFEKTRDEYIATATIDGVSVFKTMPVAYDFSDVVINQNTSKAAIIASEGTYAVTSFRYSSLDLHDIDRLAVGDSITHATWAGSPAGRWGQIACDGISAGPSDRIDEVLLHADEIIDTIRPQKVFIMIGTNSTGAFISKCQTFDTAMIGAGIDCIWLPPPPRNGADMSSFLTDLQAAFPSKVIDIYTPLLGSGYSLNAAYDGGDGTHLNAAGNAVVASTVMASPLY